MNLSQYFSLLMHTRNELRNEADTVEGLREALRQESDMHMNPLIDHFIAQHSNPDWEPSAEEWHVLEAEIKEQCPDIDIAKLNKTVYAQVVVVNQLVNGYAPNPKLTGSSVKIALLFDDADDAFDYIGHMGSHPDDRSFHEFDQPISQPAEDLEEWRRQNKDMIQQQAWCSYFNYYKKMGDKKQIIAHLERKPDLSGISYDAFMENIARDWKKTPIGFAIANDRIDLAMHFIEAGDLSNHDYYAIRHFCEFAIDNNIPELALAIIEKVRPDDGAPLFTNVADIARKAFDNGANSIPNIAPEIRAKYKRLLETHLIHFPYDLSQDMHVDINFDDLDKVAILNALLDIMPLLSDSEIAIMLVKKGADLNSFKDQNANTLLMKAVKGFITPRLFDDPPNFTGDICPADVYTNPDHAGPYYQDIAEPWIDLIELMITKGADVHAKNNNDETPLQLIEKNDTLRERLKPLINQLRSAKSSVDQSTQTEDRAESSIESQKPRAVISSIRKQIQTGDPAKSSGESRDRDSTPKRRR